MVFIAPAEAADVDASPGFSRGVEGDASRESAVCATPSGVIDAGASDGFPRWVEGWLRMEDTAWAGSNVGVCVGASAGLSRGEDDCSSGESTVCGAASGVVSGGMVGEDSAGGLGSLGWDVLMGGKSKREEIAVSCFDLQRD